MSGNFPDTTPLYYRVQSRYPILLYPHRSAEMQRDAHLTFGKIYESREALLEDIERVIDIALVDANNDAPLRLRFITPLNCSED
jgi:hypothetical protein